MPLNLDAVGQEWDAGVGSWTSKDALVYALGVGAGALDPLDELEFTTENSHDVPQRVLPTFAVVAGGLNGQGSGAAPSLGDFPLQAILHAEQSVTLHGTLPVEGSVRLTSSISGMYDKGRDALIVMETRARDAATDAPLYDTSATIFVRGEGGFGGDRGPSTPWSVPERPADSVVAYPTRPDQALLYRLSGDRNPLHSDPWLARQAGLDRPILHGLCTYGFTGRALLHAVCDSDPARFGGMSARFSAPVLPGQELTVHAWREEGRCLFQTRVGDTVVLDRGVLALADPR
ncbi:MaoC/PaaZ C-terminal domain-containing protein [Trujillonella endophytica]|uniref:Acyl dehydratase n=1 Tax=Trujillonella endophytica TaxID=673521 RepID=A0A1H8WHQ4_9ACTN|nr:MaoC/PaaZ C-terminal domain-containing protein [Trujillella endophytica]SEP27195.1 Acyl dehydratase [Trujillella endophytica]